MKQLLNYAIIWRSCGSILIPIVTLASCSNDFLPNKLKTSTTGAQQLSALADSAGNYTASMDPNGSITQFVKVPSGVIAGSAIAMPPGALSISVSVTIGQGETLASSQMSQQLGMTSNTATAAGPAVSFVPSESIMASSPFSLSIPISRSTGLGLNAAGSLDPNLVVVMFKWMKVEDGKPSYEVGMLPPKELIVSKTAVQFQTRMFGTFQIATLQQPIRDRIKQPTDEPPMLKAVAGSPLLGLWSGSCRASGSDGPGSGPGGSNPWSFDLGTTVGGSEMCSPEIIGGAPKLKLDFQSVNFNGVSPSTLNFALLKRTSSGFTPLVSTQGAATWGTLSQAELSLPLGQSEIWGNDNIVVVAPENCKFMDTSTLISTRILNYSQWAYESSTPGIPSITDTATITFNGGGTSSNYFSINAHSAGGSAYNSKLRSGDRIRILSASGVGVDVSGPASFNSIGSTLPLSNEFEIDVDTAGGFGRRFKLMSNSIYGVVTGTASLNGSISFVRVPMSFPIAGGLLNLPTFAYGLFNFMEPFLNGNGPDGPWGQGYFISSGVYGGGPYFYKVHNDPGSANFDHNLAVQSSLGATHMKPTGCRAGNFRQYALICQSAPYGTPIPSDVQAAINFVSNGGGAGTGGTGGDSEIGIQPGTMFWQRDQVKFSNNVFVYSKANFSEQNCTGKMISRLEESGSYSLGVKGADGVYPIQINMQTARAAILDPLAVTWANGNPALNCGLDDWSVAQPKDLYSTAMCSPANDDGHGPVNLKIDGTQINFQNKDGIWDDMPMTRE